jgi:DNA-binding beta-propeller fold protein YncE
VAVIVSAIGSRVRAEEPPTEKDTKAALAGIPAYRPVADWPRLPATLQLGPVSAVATDSAGQVYVLQRADPPVLVFDHLGELLRSWGDGKLKAPHGLRTDRDDHVWVTDTVRHVVLKFDSQGKLLLTLGREGLPGDGPDQFNRPTDVAIGPAGEIYVSDGYGNSRVVKFSKEGKFLMQWGSPGNRAGEFDLPHAIRTDGQGRIYVGDRENDRVQVFDSHGKFVAQWKESGAPYGLFLDGERLFVADCRARRINVMDLQGKPMGHWDTGDGESNEPHWVCVDRGAVYVAYVGGRKVQKFIAK